MAVDLPEAFLRFADRSEAWAHWLDGLPRLIQDVVSEWSLTLDGSFRSGQAALVAPVLTSQGDPAVVKFGWPHPEAEHEHLALRAWGGHGAVRLLRADPRRSVMLLERANADRDLTTLPIGQACEVVADLYRRLHRPAVPQLDLLSAHAARWADELSQLRFDGWVPRRYVDQAASLARAFSTDERSDGTLIHTDLHYFNVLASDREPWLAIDPKPLSGEPAYEVAPLLWNRWEEAVDTGNIRQALLARLFAVVDAGELDEDRVRSWVIVREMVNIMWSLTEEGAQWGADTSDWITAAITIVNAMQR
ncbi:MAG: aminoglycoside resistance protein [Propionibacteriaceae bacterium]|nr:aminoglycoside resistance protein [Propionibacteriaceae bacterium]